MSYGWMGRTPDYKASLMNTLGVQYDFYDKFADNAKRWYRRAQDNVLFMNHAIVNPPVDRNKAADQVRDVFITIQKETDAGCYVSGAKVVATSSAITHYNFLGQNAAMPVNDPDLAIMFIAPMNAPGVKLFCRASYEMMASVMGTPFDYPLSSRFDENDAIFVFDNVLIPWEDVLIYRDVEKLKTFYPRSGFVNGFQFQGCTRFAVKLDFLAGVVAKALRVTGADEFRGNQAMLGEIIAWRNLFWAISDAMAMNPVPWSGGAVLPNAQSGSSYRVFAGDAYRRVKEIVEKIIASALIYLPSSAKDFENPGDRQVSGEICARLEQHRLPRAHQDHEAVVGRGRHNQVGVPQREQEGDEAAVAVAERDGRSALGLDRLCQPVGYRIEPRPGRRRTAEARQVRHKHAVLRTQTLGEQGATPRVGQQRVEQPDRLAAAECARVDPLSQFAGLLSFRDSPPVRG